MSKVQATLSERLLSLDALPAAEDLARYRSQLDDRLAKASRLERRARWTMLGLWGAAFATLLLVMLLQNVFQIDAPEWVGAVLAFFDIAAIVETIAYFVRFRPALQRGLADRQFAALQDLSRKVDLLNERMNAQVDRPNSAKE